jgi:hypothetical protein
MKKTIICLVILLAGQHMRGQVKKQSFSNGKLTLSIETLDDSTLHIQYQAGNPSEGRIPVTDMIAKNNYNESPSAKWDSTILETSDLKVIVNTTTLSFEIIDAKRGNESLTTIHALLAGNDLNGIKGSCTEKTAFYGLGEQFKENNSSINYKGKIKEGDQYGNRMLGFNGGGGPNIQMPVMYAIEKASFKNYAVFVDNFLKQKFDLTDKNYCLPVTR